MDNKSIRIGTLYIPYGYASVMDHLHLRMQGREVYKDTEKSRMTPELRSALLEALQNILGPNVRDLKLTFSLTAGCRCPCSPGYCVSGVIVNRDYNNPLLAPALEMSSGRDKAQFYLSEDGTLEARGAERQWRLGRRGRGFKHPPIMTYLLHGKRIAPPAKAEEVQATGV